MVVYLDLVIILNFIIDWLLLIGANRLCGYPSGWKRAIPAAAIGGIYAGMCMLHNFRFLSGVFWRIAILVIIGVVAFGLRVQAFRRCAVFVLLSMSLGGIVLMLGKGGIASLICSVLLLFLTCVVGISNGIGTRSLVPVEIRFEGKCVSFVALRDTGNALRDPLTGESVLVVGAQVAQKLIGMTPGQLRRPVESLGAAEITGLRLISYRTVGRDGGLMLGMRFQEVIVGKNAGSRLVAFAPECLTDGYEGLTGGTEF